MCWFLNWFHKVRAPSPTHYQDVTRPNVKPSLKPFNMSADRFNSENKLVEPGYSVLLLKHSSVQIFRWNILRPGAYEHDVERNRNVQMLHSFGGRAKTIPHIDIKCIVYNKIKNVSLVLLIISHLIRFCFLKLKN